MDCGEAILALGSADALSLLLKRKQRMISGFSMYFILSVFVAIDSVLFVRGVRYVCLMLVVCEVYYVFCGGASARAHSLEIDDCISEVS